MSDIGGVCLRFLQELRSDFLLHTKLIFYVFYEMRLHYLDNLNEGASVFILKQLGVDIGTTFVKNGTSQHSTDWIREHSLNGSVCYNVHEGTLLVDIRDSANCWIRCHVVAGESITIPAGKFRRISCNKDSADAIGKDNNDCCVVADVSDKDLVFRFNVENDSIVTNTYHTTRELVCELCREFFKSGWVTGTGGSISIRYGNRVYMTPSGVQKERILPDELYVLDINGSKLCCPERKPGTLRAPVLSDCASLFLHAFKQRNAGAVLHSHGVLCNLATCLYEGKSEFKISHQEMIKGIAGHGYFDELVVPIIENTAYEHQLSDLLGKTIAKYPKAVAVLVRRHGMYVWGDTWEAAKRHSECLHYLFDIAVNMHRLGLGLLTPPPPVGETTTILADTCQRGFMECAARMDSPSKRMKTCSNTLSGVTQIVLDIEGTTTPITFVKDTLFPFASNGVYDYLKKTWSNDVTVADVAALKELAAVESNSDVVRALEENKENAIEKLSDYVKSLIAADKKASALKVLQGHMWEVGYSEGKLKSIVYDDVPDFFETCVAQINIYSSGSRAAQRLLFKHSDHGDLRKHISCYFDTSIGHKREKKSYEEIALFLGVDSPDQILFVTDVYEEAVAADAAGCRVLIALRPGNLELPSNNQFGTISSFADI